MCFLDFIERFQLLCFVLLLIFINLARLPDELIVVLTLRCQSWTMQILATNTLLNIVSETIQALKPKFDCTTLETEIFKQMCIMYCLSVWKML